ncbi:MAG: preprotein translocase subunit SecE [Lachnospiraceae bacterium]|nr:preprotein translocase subunit SecE [Lachnospiraceae bacterium]
MSEVTSNGKAASAEKAPKKSWFKGLKSEFKKIIWPEKKSVARQTTAVVLITTVLGVIIVVIDYLVKIGFNQLF